ncbi:unnamed protein product [Lactuca virosa]|uniref:Uncharacterized protein n=1 Tax=Lactuca virosa TaxID=75947 RepID=A0AAU9MPC9_9ASTR|nr:unnamed protein product [Lactuca virosa]
MAEQGEKRRRLVLIASPLQGHMTPMLQLGSYLHSKGFSITFAHSELNPPDPSNHPDFTFLPLPAKLSDTGGSSGFIQFLQALNDNCKPHLQKHLIQIIDAQKASSQKESIVIIHDNLMFCAGSIAGDLGLPSIIVRSSSAACVPAYRIIPQLHKVGRFPVEGNGSGTRSTQIQRHTIYWPHNTTKPEIDNIVHLKNTPGCFPMEHHRIS